MSEKHRITKICVVKTLLTQLVTIAFISLSISLMASADNVTEITAGRGHTCILESNGNVHCWGSNFNQNDQYVAQASDYTGQDAIAVTAGWYHTCVLKTDGNVHCWGDNYDGGSNTTYAGQASDYIGGDATEVTAGSYHTCVLKSNGNVHCWGDNNTGQASDYIGGDAKAVIAGAWHTCVLKSNGNVHCWGNNGDGETTDYVGGDATEVTAGDYHTCVLKSDGNVHCWGNNQYNESKDYTEGDARAVIASSYFTCVLKSNGNVHCWGDNENGQANDYLGGDARAVTAGGVHTCILKSDGNVHCWGSNHYGQAIDWPTTTTTTTTTTSSTTSTTKTTTTTTPSETSTTIIIYQQSTQTATATDYQSTQSEVGSTRGVVVKDGVNEAAIPFENIGEIDYETNGTVTVNELNGRTVKGVLLKMIFNGVAPFSGAKTCSDQTFYGECSVIKPMYCVDGVLTSRCSDCGCPPGMACQADGSCGLLFGNTCKPSLKDCYPPSGDCETDIYIDNNNCGDCSKKCPGGYFCLLGSCLENTTANKEKLAGYYLTESDRYYKLRDYADAKSYLLKAKDIYVDIKRGDKVSEIDNRLEDLNIEIETEKRLEETISLIFELFVAFFLAWVYEDLSKKKRGVRTLVIATVIFFATFLVMRLWIMPIFYDKTVVRALLALLLGAFTAIIYDKIARVKGTKRWTMNFAVFIIASLMSFAILHSILF